MHDKACQQYAWCGLNLHVNIIRYTRNIKIRCLFDFLYLYLRIYLTCNYIQKNWESGHTRYSIISSVCQRCCCHCPSVLFVSVMFSPFNLILWDHWRKWNQSWQKCYLNALFLCKSEIQDGHCHSTNLTGPYEKKIENGNYCSTKFQHRTYW